MASPWQLAQAAQIVRAGGVIAYPTEAVWGLGCNPWDIEAVQKILALKNRPMHKGLIVIAGDVSQVDFLLKELDDDLKAPMLASWPGPNTWLVPHQNLLPECVTGEHASVAIRVSDHPLVQQLCALTGPLISTSANPAGRPAAASRIRLEQYFHNRLDAIVGGELGGRRAPSTIRDLATGKVLRSS